MDATLIIREISKLKKNKLIDKEEFSTDEEYSNIFDMGFMISLLIGSYAAYLSYTCNTKENVDCVMKVIYAILAYIFGLFYLLYYFLFRNEHCLSL
jgi:hypothetical protein